MDNKQQGLEKIHEIMHEKNISLHDISLQEFQSQQSSLASRSKFFLAVAGAIFIFVGLCFFTEQQWSSFNSAERVASTLGSGFVFTVLGIVCTRNVKFHAIPAPMFILAAITQSIGLYIIADEYFVDLLSIHTTARIILGTLILQQLILFSLLRSTILLTLVILFGISLLLLELLDYYSFAQSAMILGTVFIIVGYVLQKTKYTSLTSLCYFFASSAILIATFFTFNNSIIISSLVSLTIVYLSILLSSRSMLTVGTISCFINICQYMENYLLNSLGWSLTLIVLGFIMVGVSTISYRLGNTLRKANHRDISSKKDN